jgi:hypothetical protein
MFINFDVSQDSNKYLWLINSGCSRHMTRNRNMFARQDNSIKIEVKLVDDKVVNVIGKGTVRVPAKQGENKNILDVYLVQ